MFKFIVYTYFVWTFTSSGLQRLENKTKQYTIYIINRNKSMVVIVDNEGVYSKKQNEILWSTKYAIPKSGIQTYDHRWKADAERPMKEPLRYRERKVLFCFFLNKIFIKYITKPSFYHKKVNELKSFLGRRNKAMQLKNTKNIQKRNIFSKPLNRLWFNLKKNQFCSFITETDFIITFQITF